MATLRILLSLTVMLLLVAAASAGDYTTAPAPDGFRGLKWGTPLEKIPGLLAVNKAGFDDTYFRKDERRAFGDAEINSVAYYFRKDRLYRVGVSFSGRANHFLIKERLMAMYGPGRGVGQRYGWMWPEFSVELDYDDDAGSGALYYTYEGAFE
ncbi:hypothetical protein [Pseudodesulfovibrio sp.]|uniref:hypothetical protein n=1 Tax=Pseudodesulfovibrio sp. TaxID=2035812 RepID=UPI00261EE85E|nr:hypothetical protein [Pseudodesulfovibrio sp.]MDD3311296.1 hypothetical protein [Pseudodesulfovibrio sp.]